MRQLPLILFVTCLSACGVETATTAVTVGEMKAKEAQEGKEKMDQMQKSIDDAMRQAEERRRSGY